MQIEKIMQADTGLFSADLSRLERTENFMRATADGLELDVSDYFTFWKYPVDDLSDYMSKYPKSSKINDNDGDGVSSLEGDLNDNDASIFPYAPELIDGKDNNQDGLIDETVYTEDGGDIDSINITLPAQINAELDDLADEDSFVFTLTEDAAVTFTIYAKDSDSVVAYKPGSKRQLSTISGTMYLDGGEYNELIHEAMSAPESNSAKFLKAGTHTIRIAAIGMDGINPNPGSYEIQAFINEYDPGFTTSSLLAEIYPSDISVSPASHDFGNVSTVETSTALSFTVSNNGDADLIIGIISLTGTDSSEFSIQNDLCSGQTVAPSGSCTFEAVFSPTIEATANANLSIPSNDSIRPTLDVPLSGTGITCKNPTPNIKANGSDNTITTGTDDTLSITVSLCAGDSSSVNCDWWVAADTPFGWFYYNPSMGWTPGLSFTYQGPLSDLGTFTVLNMSSLPIGTYTFYFTVDMNMNGVLDFDSLYYDSVVVNITP
jgi:hypothetical protein